MAYPDRERSRDAEFRRLWARNVAEAQRAEGDKRDMARGVTLEGGEPLTLWVKHRHV